MNLSSKVTAAATFGLAILVAQVGYSFPGAGVPEVNAVIALGQASARAEQDPAALLRMARQAIDRKQLDAAEQYLQQAESSWSRRGFSPFGDTPKKVRRDLETAKNRASGTPRPSSQSRPLFASPFGSRKTEPKTDPFKGAGQDIDALLNDKKGKAASFLKKGRAALASGDRVGAEHYAKMALETGAQFGPQEDSPRRFWAELTGGAPLPAAPAARRAAAPPARTQPAARGYRPLPPVSAPAPAELAPPRTLPSTSQLGTPVDLNRRRATASRAVYDPSTDDSRIAAATAELPAYPRTGQADRTIQLVSGVEELDSRDESSVDSPPRSGLALRSPAKSAEPRGAESRRAEPRHAEAPATAAQLMAAGDQALVDRDPVRASQYFRQAAAYQDELDEATVQRLQDRIQLTAVPRSTPTQQPNRLLEEATASQLRMRQQINFEVKRRVSQAMQLTKRDPKTAVQMLTDMSAFVEKSELSESDKRQLTSFVDRNLSDVRKYMTDHRAELQLNETNQARRENIERGKRHAVEVDQRLAKIVDDYNRLVDEERYAEAVVLAKKAREMAPDNPVAMQLWHNARFVQRVMNNSDLINAKEEYVWQGLHEVELASAGTVGDNPIDYGTSWSTITEGRNQFRDAERQRHPKELEIENALRQPMPMKFRETPLSEVINQLTQLSGINIYLDPMGLSEEGIHPSTPITIDLQDEISLKSALNLMLEPLQLSYVIQNEVLKITSEQLRDSSVYTKMYNVADLVIPLPNFAPHNRVGLPQAMADAYGATIGSIGGGAPPVMVSADPVGLPGAMESAQGLAQTMDSSGGFGSGGRGGDTNADFDPLIELITTTIDPDTWEEAGGAGRLSEFETNLSLVVSQTQEVHDKIRDLLEQLRRLQDLQVTIEVRFITLDDDFFERIGVDFNFNIEDKSAGLDVEADIQRHTLTPGFDGFSPEDSRPIYSQDLDVQVRNGSFPGLIPGGFAGFDPVSQVGTSLGFAILSDIEAFFLIEASQSDSRSNLLQAPKVTLFNGQAASISSQLQRPFVTSVVPVVGDFAAAQAPVIAVLPEGTTLSVQAVVSADRRYVRLTLVPFFSEIRDVETFTFTGSSTSTTASSDDTADEGDTTSTATATETTTSGTTIQLPEFQFTTVTTTVSVPDGGTVLLGGIKQLVERRTERGTPILAKIPYISRLFKNVGIGRETSSLMLMVTPRIIIQEEEEKRNGLN